MAASDNELAAAAKAGDALAEEQLIARYMGLVKSVARSFFVTGAELERDDLIQAGMLGLVKAARSFDAGGKASFKTYASRCVRNSMVDELRRSSALPSDPLPESTVEDGHPALLWEAISAELSPEELSVLEMYLDACSYKEISEKLGIELKRVDNLIYSMRKKLKRMLGEGV